VPKVAGATYTFGWPCVFDPRPETKLLLAWGNNQIYLMGGFVREEMRSALQGGAKLVIIDPRRVDIARRADIWVHPRPSTDGVLALGMIKVIIEEKIYDADFVNQWTVGFDKLEEHVKTFSLDEVETVTWVPRATIEETARLLARTKPLALVVGNGIERNFNAFQTLRSVFILRAILGDINTLGGNGCLTPPSYTRLGNFFNLKGSVRMEKMKSNQVLGPEYRIAQGAAYIPIQTFVKALLDEKPYPIKAAVCLLTDPLMSYPDTEATYRAFMKLDFTVVSEIFHTPTTNVADIVLPAAWGAEHDGLGYWPGYHEEIRAYPKLVEPPGEARSDADWINELSAKMGLEGVWKSEEEALDFMLKPSGTTWEEFKKIRSFEGKKEYKRPDEGIFKTRSGKVEIYSAALEKLGYQPIPTFGELSQFRFETSAEFPLMLFNGKEAAYMLTGYKQVEFLKKMRPNPVVELHPDTAARFGLKEGDWIYIETKKGRIKQVLSLDPNLDPRLVYVAFGWYFPEESEDLYQFRRSNINVLTDIDPPYENLTGAIELGGIPCRVYKTEL
jgi:anaerobic selenocysteine-containing dehydrogenase